MRQRRCAEVVAVHSCRKKRPAVNLHYFLVLRIGYEVVAAASRLGSIIWRHVGA